MTATHTAVSPALSSAIASDAKALFAHSEGMIDAAATTAAPADMPANPSSQPLRRLIIVDENWW